MKSYFGRFVAAVVIAAGGWVGSSADAATFTWRTGAGTNAWNLGSNWLGGATPVSSSSTFLEYTTNTSASVTTNNNLANPFDLFQLLINGTTTYTFSGSPMRFATGGSIVNTASVAQTINSTINAGATFSITTGSLLNLNGGIAGTSNVALAGTGTIALDGNANDSSIEVIGGGTLNIKNNRSVGELLVTSGRLELSGADSGVATVSNGATFTAGSVVAMDVAGTFPGPGGYDQLVSDTVTFGGALNLDLNGLTDLGGVGDRGTLFDIFVANSYAGNFSTISSIGSAPYSGLSWSLNPAGNWESSTFGANGNYLGFIPATGQLVVVPEPSTIVFAALGAAISGWHCINKRRRSRSVIAG